MADINESKIEKNLKLRAEYLKSLRAITYEEIVDMLNDKNIHYQIEFYDKLDILNDIHYSCVSVSKNNNTSTIQEYLSINQDFKDIYSNLISTLREKETEPVFQIFTNYSGFNQLACNIGDNILIFPQEIMDELMVNASEYLDRNANNVLCLAGNEELFIPSSLSNKKVKTKNNGKK